MIFYQPLVSHVVVTMIKQDVVCGVTCAFSVWGSVSKAQNTCHLYMCQTTFLLDRALVKSHVAVGCAFFQVWLSRAAVLWVVIESYKW